MKIKATLRRATALLLTIFLLAVPALAEVDNPYSEVPEDTASSYQEEKSGLERSFPDVPQDADYAQAVSMLAELEIITGDERGNFNPDSTVTRGEMAAILCRLLEEPQAGKDTGFQDVSSDHWAAGYVTRAVELGFVNGYGNGNFGPQDPVTCEQVVKMLVCAWGYEEEAQAEGGWPQGYWNVAGDLGIRQEVTAGPTENAPRSAVAVFCCNTLNIAQGNTFLAE